MGRGAAVGWRPDLQGEVYDSEEPEARRRGCGQSQEARLKTGHCLSGQCLQWTKDRPTAQRWWCQRHKQTRYHLFKVCPG